MPQPLSTFPITVAGKPVQWDPGALSKHPKFAAQVLETIAIWSHNDQFLAQIITNFLSSDVELVSAILREIRREAVTSSIDAAAKLRLGDDHYRLFAASLATTKGSRNRRDEFAHHIWGTSDALPDALILADPRDLNKEIAGFMGPLHRGQNVAPVYANGLPWDSSKYYVYKSKDLEVSLAEATRARKVIGLLCQMSQINQPFFDQVRFSSTCDELMADPLIQQALDVRSKRKSP